MNPELYNQLSILHGAFTYHRGGGNNLLTLVSNDHLDHSERFLHEELNRAENDFDDSLRMVMINMGYRNEFLEELVDHNKNRCARISKQLSLIRRQRETLKYSERVNTRIIEQCLSSINYLRKELL